MTQLENRFPNLELLDEEYFPLSNDFILWSIVWMISKILLDLLVESILKITNNAKFIRTSKYEKLLPEMLGKNN